MIKDFPKIAQAMGGAEPTGEGGLMTVPHADEEVLSAGLRGAANAAAATRSLRDLVRRGQLIDELSKAVKLAQEGGPYELPSDEF